MPTSLFQFEMLPATWVYLSALMILALFYKFNRFWSIRNFDLFGLIFLSPGLLFLAMKDDHLGYVWMLGACLYLFARLLFDTTMFRRPLLEPNLTPEGLTFACVALFAFLVGGVVVNRGDRVDSSRTVRLEQILTLQPHKTQKDSRRTVFPRADSEPSIFPHFPGYRPFFAFVETTNKAVGASSALRSQLEPRLVHGTGNSPDSGTSLLSLEMEEMIGVESFTDPNSGVEILKNAEIGDGSSPGPISPALPEPANVGEMVSAILSNGPSEAPSQEELSSSQAPLSIFADALSISAIVLSHLCIVLGFLFIGNNHFGNIRTGIAASTIFLLHPYTNQMVGRIDHFIPAALLLWAIVFYRRPIFSGLFVGIASALVFYPIFLVPLWCSFYWKRGWIRFLGSVVFVYVLFVSLISCTPAEYGSFWNQLANMFGKSSLLYENPEGIWDAWAPFYRIPIIALFFAFAFGLLLWPTHKNLATLLSCSAAIMVGTQFWQIHQGGLYMGWFLPLLILTVFRPNLEDRTALTAVVDIRRFF